MSFQEIISKYWWVILILVGALAFWLYTKQDAYTKKQIGKVLNKRNLLIAGFVIGWWVWNKYGSSHEISNANQWMPIIGLVFLAGSQFMEALKYKTQQFNCPNMHGSYAKNPLRVNGFLIYAIDSFNAGGISWEHAKRIFVVREETTELFNHGSTSIANLGHVSKYELDDDVRSLIESNKFLKGAEQEIYYGWFDDIERVDWDFQKLKELDDTKNDPKSIYNLLKKELGVSNPSVSKLYWLYRNECKAVTKQTEQFDATVNAVEKGVEHTKRVKDAYSGGNDNGTKVEGHEEY